MLKTADHISITEVDGEAVILDLNTGAYFGLNHVGRQFVQDIQEGLSLEQSATQIAAEYSVEEELVRQDLEQLLADLLEKSLLVES